MVRLPGVMAPSRELPVGVGGNARDTRFGPPTMCSMQTHRWPDGCQLVGTGAIGRFGRWPTSNAAMALNECARPLIGQVTFFEGTIVGSAGGDRVYSVVWPDDATKTYQDLYSEMIRKARRISRLASTGGELLVPWGFRDTCRLY
jgi:hypothetical protein